MKKIVVLAALAMAVQPTAAFAGRPDFPAYHGQKDEPFNWCNFFAEGGMVTPYRIFCIERA